MKAFLVFLALLGVAPGDAQEAKVMWKPNNDGATEATPEVLNTVAFVRFLTLFGIALAIASSAHPLLFAAIFSQLLLLAAFTLTGVAAFTREPFWAEHFTRWDIAAALWWSSIFSRQFIDRLAVEELLASGF